MRTRAAALILIVAALTACASPAPVSPFVTAKEECRLVNSEFAVIQDDGRSLTIDHKGEDDFRGLPFDRIECLLDALDVPSSVKDKMLHTRALDGMQTDSWDGIEATWTYHPDAGLDIILELG